MKRILVLDSSESILLLYAVELADAGYEVFTGMCDEGVFDRIEQTSPDLIVCDQKPWEEHREGLVGQIRNRYRDIPLVLCTVLPDLNSSWKADLSVYSIAKSSDLTELKNTVATALDSKLESGQEIDSSLLTEGGSLYASTAA